MTTPEANAAEPEPPSTVAGPSEPVPSSPVLSSSSAITEFSPEAHSWILVPEAIQSSLLGLAAATHTPPMSPALPPRGPVSSGGASPKLLRDAGVDISHLAVSEILSAESAYPCSTATPPPMISPCSDASYEEPAAVPFTPTKAEARKLGALAFPPVGPPKGDSSFSSKDASSGGKEAGEAAEETASEAGSDLIDELLDPFFCWGQQWARPIALVAVLVASHAACLLIGVAVGNALGKAQATLTDKSLARGDGPYLTRRFSSGGYGTRARLCDAGCHP